MGGLRSCPLPRRWHEHHAAAHKALLGRPRLIAHAAVESYSALTRMPPPFRAQPSIVHTFISENFANPFLTLSEIGYQELLATLASNQIQGGAAYDALIAFTAAEHEATLLSLDQAYVAHDVVGGVGGRSAVAARRIPPAAMAAETPNASW